MTKEVKAKDIKAAPENAAIHRKFSGVVVSDKMDKTVVVKVETTKVHPKYGKRYVESVKYKVHDEKNQSKTGDKVSFVECRPLSKDKRWRISAK